MDNKLSVCNRSDIPIVHFPSSKNCEEVLDITLLAMDCEILSEVSSFRIHIAFPKTHGCLLSYRKRTGALHKVISMVKQLLHYKQYTVAYANYLVILVSGMFSYVMNGIIKEQWKVVPVDSKIRAWHKSDQSGGDAIHDPSSTSRG